MGVNTIESHKDRADFREQCPLGKVILRTKVQAVPLDVSRRGTRRLQTCQAPRGAKASSESTMRDNNVTNY